MKQSLEEWINELIEEDRLSEFYTSRPWRRVRAESFKLYNYECQECKRNGRLTLLGHPGKRLRAGEVRGIGHHKQSLREHPELALSVSNIEPECWACHNVIEKAGTDSIVTEELFE